jgi:hypothetical protein
MSQLHRECSLLLVSACLSLAGLLCLSSSAFGQLLHIDQEIEVRGLSSITSPSPHSSGMLVTSLTAIIHDSEVCCGRDSALEDSIAKANPKSLQDVAAKLNGRHLLGDGRPIAVNAEFFPADKMSAGYLVTTMTSQRAPLMEWNSRIYVVHGLIFFWTESGTPDAPAGPVPVVHKLLLWDTRYSDSRREAVFNRDSDDLGKVQGFLFIQVKPQ